MEKQNHILHINCNYIGTALHQTMIEHLEETGVKSRVYVPTYSVKTAIIKPNDNVCVSECFRRWNRCVFDYKQAKIFTDIQSKIDVSSFQMIHAYTLFTDGNCAMKLSQKYGIPYVVAIRDTDVNTFLKRMIHLRGRGVKIMQRASAIFFLSEAYKKQVFDKYVPAHLKEELLRKSYIIPNGIHQFWLNHKVEKKKKVCSDIQCSKKIKLIFAGQISKRKNVSTTVDAVKILRDQGWDATLTVVGKVVDESEYQKILNFPYVTHIPFLPKEDLIEYYRNSDIFVMPSRTETFGLVYAEAMSQGLPIIYSKGQGFDGQFPEGVVGYGIMWNDAQNVAERILDIFRDYERIAANCVEFSDKFEWKKIVETYQKIYEAMI